MAKNKKGTTISSNQPDSPASQYTSTIPTIKEEWKYFVANQPFYDSELVSYAIVIQSSKKIKGEQQKELRRIQSEAYKKVEEIKGKADAEATKIYAESFGKDPEFYSFINTLEIYKKSLDENIKIILSTNSDFFKYLKKYDNK